MNCPNCNCDIREGVVLPYHCSCGLRIENAEDFVRCPHLGDPTGEVVACGGCNSGELPVRKCALHVVTIQRRHVVKAANKAWDGINCLDCKAKGLDQ